MDIDEDNKDSLTLGTSSTGGQIKIYFNIDDDDDYLIKKFDKAIKYWKKISLISGKSK